MAHVSDCWFLSDGRGHYWQAGTWEERGHNDWAKARVNELIVGKTIDIPAGGAGAKAEVKTVKTFKGDATVVMVRGQPRHGFDFDITLTWEASGFDGDDDDAKPVKGTIHIPEASRDTVDDDELEYTVTVEERKSDRRAQEDAAYKVLKSGLRDFFHKSFATVDKELKVRAENGA